MAIHCLWPVHCLYASLIYELKVPKGRLWTLQVAVLAVFLRVRCHSRRTWAWYARRVALLSGSWCFGWFLRLRKKLASAKGYNPSMHLESCPILVIHQEIVRCSLSSSTPPWSPGSHQGWAPNHILGHLCLKGQQTILVAFLWPSCPLSKDLTIV